MGHEKEMEKLGERQVHLLKVVVEEIKQLRQSVQAVLIIVGQCAKGRRAASFGWKVGLPKQKVKERMPLEIQLTNEQEVTVTLAPKTDTGKVAKLDGVPTWEVVQGTSQVIPSADGMSADIISSDDPGDTIVMVKADADLGEGTEELADTITASVIGATAKNLGLSASTPRPKRTTEPQP